MTPFNTLEGLRKYGNTEQSPGVPTFMDLSEKRCATKVIEAYFAWKAEGKPHVR